MFGLKTKKSKWYRFRPFALLFAALQGLYPRHLIIHRRHLTTRLPRSLIVPLYCGRVKGRLRCPPDISLVLAHNQEELPILEHSLRYVGIKDYLVLKPKDGKWPSNTMKLTLLKAFIDSHECNSEYLFYIDSNDAILMGDPAKAVQYLNEKDCDLLFSSTPGHKMIDFLPDSRIWADQLAKEHGYNNLYLNAGVFVGRTAFINEVLNVALEYVTDQDVNSKERDKLRLQGKLEEALPELPKGGGSDQMILCHLHPQFYPRMQIDYERKLAYR